MYETQEMKTGSQVTTKSKVGGTLERYTVSDESSCEDESLTTCVSIERVERGQSLIQWSSTEEG
jgi:hypothetical protein